MLKKLSKYHDVTTKLDTYGELAPTNQFVSVSKLSFR